MLKPLQRIRPEPHLYLTFDADIPAERIKQQCSNRFSLQDDVIC
jgi:hypothetical protein